MKYYVDFDDFFEGNTDLETLQLIKKMVPDFKVTLFTIVGRCSHPFLMTVKDIDWVQLVPHGWMHPDNHECSFWTEGQMQHYLKYVESVNAKLGGCYEKGFKAPGWQISDACYKVLADRGYWVADQQYNDARRAAYGIRCYRLDHPNKIHGHIGHLNGYNYNALQLIKNVILGLPNEEFGFVTEALTNP